MKRRSSPCYVSACDAEKCSDDDDDDDDDKVAGETETDVENVNTYCDHEMCGGWDTDMRWR